MNRKYSYNKNTDKTIWIDLDNSPHVPFFKPLINGLQSEGYTIRVSARNYSQTVELAQLNGLDFDVIGKHFGKNKFIKIIGLIYRALQLFPFILKKRPTIAISHGSRSQMLAAYFFKIPVVVFLDYEFVQTIPFVKPAAMFFPNIISKERLSKFRFKVLTYPGIKEDIYVPSFKPDENIKKHLHFRDDIVTIIIRPPAYQAHYHNPESDLLFNEVMKYISESNNVKGIILPRDNQQKVRIENSYKNQFASGKFIIPSDVIDGLNLMWYSDLVISGGGTMNREAAALGVPVYSIFRGKIGDVDKHLSQNGRLTLVESVEDVRNKITFEKRFKSNKPENLNSLAFHSIINDLENLISEISGERKNHSVDENNEEILSFPKKLNTK